MATLFDTPLSRAITRLTSPYAMQERVYRNRVDAIETVTPLEVIAIEDADHLKRVLDAATSMPYDLRREVAWALQDEAWVEDHVTHMQLVSAMPNTGVFERLTDALRQHSWRRITA